MPLFPSPTARFDKELLKGTTELMVMGLLNESALHGYGIAKALRERSSDRMRVNEGALYPLLHRLEREGHLRATQEQTGSRPRKRYRLTAAGRRYLARRTSEWRALVQLVDGLLPGEE